MWPWVIYRQFFRTDDLDEEVDSFESSYDENENKAINRKRSLSAEISKLRPPSKVQKVMSKLEKEISFLGEYHVNDKSLKAVNMATHGLPDHTYSAVGFNIHGQPKGHVIRIKGFSIGGMLNRVRIYMCKNTMSFSS